jgi:hypothetical protein
MSKRSEIERRLAAIEAELRARYLTMNIIIAHGGLMPEPVFAVVESGLELFREYPSETLEAFVERSATWARDLGAKRLLVGGLPNSPAQEEAMRKAHEWYMANEYDEVPPCEGESYTPPAHVSPLARAMAKQRTTDDSGEA